MTTDTLARASSEPVKMSKRAGDFVTPREVIDEVRSDAIRFMMLTRSSDAPLHCDLAKVVEHSKDNPVNTRTPASTRFTDRLCWVFRT